MLWCKLKQKEQLIQLTIVLTEVTGHDGSLYVSWNIYFHKWLIIYFYFS